MSALRAGVEVERVGARELRVPSAALLHDPLLGGKIAVDDPEALREALGPFKVVGESPGEVAADVGALRDRARHFRDIAAQEPDAPLVADCAVGARAVAVG